MFDKFCLNCHKAKIESIVCTCGSEAEYVNPLAKHCKPVWDDVGALDSKLARLGKMLVGNV